MKADRLLNLLLLLQARGRLSGRELAEQLEVSERTVHRDMEALSASGVPVFALRGSQGGWQLDENWRTEVPGLSEAELRALLMAQPRVLGHPRLIAAAEAAYNKLVAALPRNMRQQAAAMRERLHVDPTGWNVSGEDLSMLPTVQDAVSQDRQLTFEYTRADGARSPRIVDPLGIVAKGASWYLVARSTKGTRTYRVSRMSDVTPLPTTFKRPADFDLPRYWKESTAELERQQRRFTTIVSMDPAAASSLATWCEVTQQSQRASGTSESWLTLKVHFDNERHAAFTLLGFGARAYVVEPASLREQIYESANAILALTKSMKPIKNSKKLNKALSKSNRVTHRKQT
jgi:predicted DNA-binding transcriptional regulator YafY